MKKNIKCTVGDLIKQMKEQYLREGDQAFCDTDWHIYVAGDGDWLLTTACCITEPPDFDEATEEEILPAFAVENQMDGSVLPEIFQDVVSSTLHQKRDASDEEILAALNYYMDMDSFMVF
ncbi:MAG: hypothetical protein HFE45_01265 [Oscillospiraceae bacterium]|nr:hypothetical protein [Oscillospiraceae bacterium]